jgi:hypothetical protein
VLFRAACIVWLLRRRAGMATNSSGGGSWMPWLLSKHSVQKRVELPFLTVIVTEALKKALVTMSSAIGIDAHGLLGLVRLN